MHHYIYTSAHGGPGTRWWFLLLLITLMIAGVAVWLYHNAVLRFQQKFIAEYEEAQRQPRQPHSSAEPPALGADGDHLMASDGTEAEYEDVLAQLEQRRQELRRPKPR